MFEVFLRFFKLPLFDNVTKITVYIWLMIENRTVCVHSVGGTGPLRIAAELLNGQLGYKTALYSNPTWMNHKDIFIK